MSRLYPAGSRVLNRCQQINFSSQKYRCSVTGGAVVTTQRHAEAAKELHSLVSKGTPHLLTLGTSGCWSHSPALATYCSSSGQGGPELSDADIKKAIDSISENFSEAMELMSDARSSSGTVYFSEDVEDTQKQVADTLQEYNALLAKLSNKQRKKVIQSVGLKMEELKAQMSLLEELARE